MDPRANRIFQQMQGKGTPAAGNRRMYNTNGIVEGEMDYPPGGGLGSIPLPKDKAIDTNKTTKFTGLGKWTVYGGVAGLLYGIIFGKGIVGTTLIGGGVGFGAGLLLGKGKKPQSKDDAQELLDEILSTSGKLTEEGVALLKDQYVKLQAEWNKNAPAVGVKLTAVQSQIIAKQEAIKAKLKDSGISVNG